MFSQDEGKRLEAVKRFLNLDFQRIREFQEIVDLVAELCEKPVALITLLDKDLNWIKVKRGVDTEVVPREISFCQFGIQQDDILIIPDASKDERFDNNPLVHQAPHVRFYASAPLVVKDSWRVGTLCLFDVAPGELTPIQQKTLDVLARQVSYLMELEVSHHVLNKQIAEITAQNASLRRIAHMQSHDIRQPLTSIMGLVNTIRDDRYVADKERLIMIEEAALQLDRMVHAVVELTRLHE